MLEAIQSNLYTGLLLFPVSCLSSLPHWAGVCGVTLLGLRGQLRSSRETLALRLELSLVIKLQFMRERAVLIQETVQQRFHCVCVFKNPELG